MSYLKDTPLNIILRGLDNDQLALVQQITNTLIVWIPHGITAIRNCGHHCSGNGLAPVRRQAIAWPNPDFIVNWTMRYELQWNFNKKTNTFFK